MFSSPKRLVAVVAAAVLATAPLAAQSSVIGDFVYCDQNSDGVFNAGDMTLDGVAVSISCQPDGGSACAQYSSISGTYHQSVSEDAALTYADFCRGLGSIDPYEPDVIAGRYLFDIFSSDGSDPCPIVGTSEDPFQNFPITCTITVDQSTAPADCNMLLAPVAGAFPADNNNDGDFCDPGDGPFPENQPLGNVPAYDGCEDFPDPAPATGAYTTIVQAPIDDDIESCIIWNDFAFTPVTEVCGIDLAVSANPSSILPVAPPSCETVDDLQSVTFRYTGGSCADGNNGQSGAASCSGDPAGAAPVELIYTGKDPDEITVDPSGEVIGLGDFVTLAATGRDKLHSNSEVEVRQGGALLQSLEIHTSCSKALAVGDIFGALEVVELNGVGGSSNEVELTYQVTATESALTGVTVTDTVLGPVGGPVDLAAGASQSFQVLTSVASSTTFSATAAGATAVAGLTCDATASADVTVLQPCDECDGQVNELTLLFAGPATRFVEVYEDDDAKADERLFAGNIAPGESFTFMGLGDDGRMGSKIFVFVDGEVHTEIHTSCSQPIGPGLVFGDFEVLAGTSRHGGNLCPIFTDCEPAGDGFLEIKKEKVKWELTNTGSTPIIISRVQLSWPMQNGDLEKVKLNGDIYKQVSPPLSVDITSGWESGIDHRTLDAGETKKLEFEFENDAVNDQSLYQIRIEFGADCALEFVAGSNPPGPYECKKPMDALSMVWDGTQAVDVVGYRGDGDDPVADSASSVAVGDTVTLSGFTGSPNNIIWEVFAAGTSTLLGESTFHLSCSDDDMDGPEDCGKRQGNGKDNNGGFLNDWLLDGLVTAGGTFDCTP